MAETTVKKSTSRADQVQGIDIFRVLSTFRKKWYVIAAMAVVFGIVGFVMAVATYVPVYAADCSFYVTSGDTSSTINTNDLYASSQVADIFKSIANSRNVRLAVVDKLREDDPNIYGIPASMSVQKLQGQILAATFIAATPEDAKKPVTHLRRFSPRQRPALLAVIARRTFLTRLCLIPRRWQTATKKLTRQSAL